MCVAEWSIPTWYDGGVFWLSLSLACNFTTSHEPVRIPLEGRKKSSQSSQKREIDVEWASYRLEEGVEEQYSHHRARHRLDRQERRSADYRLLHRMIAQVHQNRFSLLLEGCMHKEFGKRPRTNVVRFGDKRKMFTICTH